MNDVERGRTLRELRKLTGLSQRDVGAHFGIDKNSVSLWERGKSRPTVDKLPTLDRLYNAEGAVLRLWSTEPQPGRVGKRNSPHTDAVALLEDRVATLEAAVRQGLPNLTELGEGVKANIVDLAALAKRVSELERRFPRRRDA